MNIKPQTTNLKPEFYFHLITFFWVLQPVILQAEESPIAVPIYEEPRHRLVFDKAPVKIVNVNIPPDDISRYHFHEDPTLYVAINGALMRSQDLGNAWGEPDPNARHGTGSLVFRNYRIAPQSHRVENLDKVSFRLIGIVHRGKGMPVTETDNEAVIDNDWFLGRNFSLAPGEETCEHLHDKPVVVVQVSDGNTTVVEQGLSIAEKTVIGNWSWHDAGTRHVLKNIGTSEAELVEIEIK